MLLAQDGIVPTENVSSDRLVSSLSENIEDSSKPLENLHESAQNPSISATDAAVNFESTAQPYSLKNINLLRRVMKI
jgi:DNA polymerase-3 subunit gamma/tau